jgi:hypothetical protein
MDNFILQSFGGAEASAKGFKLFFLIVCITIYVIWVLFNNWKEKDPKRRLVEFFTVFGKLFALIISIQFLIFLALILLG